MPSRKRITPAARHIYPIAFSFFLSVFLSFLRQGIVKVPGERHLLAKELETELLWIGLLSLEVLRTATFYEDNLIYSLEQNQEAIIK